MAVVKMKKSRRKSRRKSKPSATVPKTSRTALNIDSLIDCWRRVATCGVRRLIPMSSEHQKDILQDWRESAPYWARHADTVRSLFEPITHALIQASGIIEGQTVLDVAGGVGEPSISVSRVVGGSGLVICTDAVGEMVATARACRPGPTHKYRIHAVFRRIPSVLRSDIRRGRKQARSDVVSRSSGRDSGDAARRETRRANITRFGGTETRIHSSVW